jgi:sulfite reductase alpha subunit
MYTEPPYENVKELLSKIFEWWDEHGKMRERVGELIQRVGLQRFCEAMGLPVAPQMVWRPRANPYVFWKEEEVPGGFKRDINDYRSRHAR